MSVKTKRIPDDVLGIISRLEVAGSVARITDGQLDRKTYLALDGVLKALGGKWNSKAMGHVFAGDPAEDLERVILAGEIAPLDFNGFFPTPPDLVEELVARAVINELGMDVLEPSAGHGAIADALEARGCRVQCIELMAENATVLSANGHTVFQGDFLAIPTSFFSSGFDRIVMNPPFAKQQDLEHVRHAWDFLKRGGRLVSVMAAGVIFRENRRTQEFRAWVDANNGEFFDNDPDAFKASGTRVRTVTLVLDKET